MISFTALTLILSAYLAGSLSGAILAARLFRLPDPRSQGSRNPGATNMYRLGGLLPAVLTLGIDMLKGAVPAGLARTLELTVLEQSLVGLFAIFGHMLPVFHSFRGGKGVATALGVGLALATWTTILLALIWGMLFWRSKTSSFASLVCAALAPIIAWFFNPEYTLLFLLLTPVIVLRHRENIIKLIRHQERHF